MDNHVHLILVPETAGGLRAALGEAHRNYGDSLLNTANSGITVPVY